MKKPSLQALRGRVEKIAGAVEARVGHVIGNDTLERSGLKMQTTGEARRKASSKKKAAPEQTAGPEKGGAVAVAEEVTPEVVQEVAPTTDAPPVEVAPAEKKRAPKNKPDAPAKKKAKSVVQPDAPKPNRAHRRHPDQH